MNIEDVEVKKKLKVVFMGTPLFSVPVLKSLIEKYQVLAIVTQPDKPIGRGGKIGISRSHQRSMSHKSCLCCQRPERAGS